MKAMLFRCLLAALLAFAPTLALADKAAINEYDTTASGNEDVGGVNIQGTAPASNMDDGLREIMSHLAEANAGTNPVADTWTFGDPADLTKRVRIDAGGITTATTRVLTAPDASGTIALISPASASGAASIDFAEDTDNGSNKVTLSGPAALSSDITVTLPTTTGNLITDAESKIELGTPQATTSGTSISFTGIPSWARRVTILFSGISTSGTSVPILQLGDSGGIETSGYAGNAGYIGHSVSTGLAQYTAGFGMNSSHAASNTYSGRAIFELLNASNNTWIYEMKGTYDSLVFTIHGEGVKSLSGTLTQIALTTVGGSDTFDAGSANISWE